MIETVVWYAWLTFVGAGSLLPSTVLFGQLRSAGALCARPLGLLLVAEIAWLVSALSPIPYGTGLVGASVGMLWVCTALLAWRRWDLVSAIWRRRRLLVAGEVLLALLFILLVVVRAQNPAAFGNEKPMEIMLLTSVHNASSMPPPDPWFAGHTVSYYHLGYVAIDVVSRLAGLGPGEAFNLGLVTAGALAGVAIFALAGDLLSLSNVRRSASPVLAGACAVVSLLLVAPLQGALELLAAAGIGSQRLWAGLGVEGFPGPHSTAGIEPKPHWWWWHTTRVLPDTITEFPAFSLLLGDVHPHVLALPLGVLALALAATTLASEDLPGFSYWCARPGAYLLAAMLFAGMLMTNSWDVVPYGSVWLAAALLSSTRTRCPVRTLIFAGLHVGLPAMGALLLALPFLTQLHSSIEGFAPVVKASDPTRFVLVWVPLVVPLVAGPVLLRPRAWSAQIIGGIIAGVALIAVWAGVLLSNGHRRTLAERGSGWLVLAFLVISSSAACAAAYRSYRESDRASAAWLGLAGGGCVVILGTELIRVVDFSLESRANTVFKFWYSVWLLMSVASAVVIAGWFDRALGMSRRALAVLVLSVPLYVGSLTYAPAVLLSRIGESQEPAVDALAFYRRHDPELYQGILWVRANLGEQDVLLEAAGNSFGYANLISATTGTPTLLGWLQHEQTWRGRIAEISERQAMVDAIFSEGATERMRKLATRCGVTHIYLGREESLRYGPGVFDRFAAWPTIFETPHTRIVKVP